MTDDPRRRLRGPLARYATQIREGAEQLEHEQQRGPQRRPGRRRPRLLSLSMGVLIAAVASGIIIVLDTGGPAHAESVVNKAPAAAAASESVSFTSNIKITLGSHQLEDYMQTGAIDFAHHSFSTLLSLGHEGGAIIQRRVGDHLYISQIRHGASRPTRWRSVRLSHEPVNRFAAGPESEQFTAPPSILDGLASTRSPVTAAGKEVVNGVPTSVYELHTNLADLLHAATGGRSQPSSYRDVQATIRVALDAKGRPRRVTETFYATRAQITTTVTFAGYGAPVHIIQPPNSAVVAHAPTAAPEPFAVSPSRVFERLLFLDTKLDRFAR